jgi:hypothetical protein
MKIPGKKERPADANMRMHSVLQDVIALGNKPIVAPKKKRKKP